MPPHPRIARLMACTPTDPSDCFRHCRFPTDRHSPCSRCPGGEDGCGCSLWGRGRGHFFGPCPVFGITLRGCHPLFRLFTCGCSVAGQGRRLPPSGERTKNDAVPRTLCFGRLFRPSIADEHNTAVRSFPAQPWRRARMLQAVREMATTTAYTVGSSTNIKWHEVEHFS